jgi:hypothetical protein
LVGYWWEVSITNRSLSIKFGQSWKTSLVTHSMTLRQTRTKVLPGSFLCTQLLKKFTVRSIYCVPNCNIQSNSALCIPLCVTHSQIPRASLCVTHS